MTFQSIGDVAANIVNGLASERTYAGGKITEPGVDIERKYIIKAAIALDERLVLGLTAEQGTEERSR